jgi:hypothetical protein
MIFKHGNLSHRWITILTGCAENTYIIREG